MTNRVGHFVLTPEELRRRDELLKKYIGEEKKKAKNPNEKNRGALEDYIKSEIASLKTKE